MAKETTAQKWQERFDHNAQEQMQNEAVGEVEEYGTWVYIFEDGSSLYEKHRGDWRTGDLYAKCPECEEWRNADSDYTSTDGGKCNECFADVEEKVSE